MSWLRSTVGVNKIHKLNYCHICTIILILQIGNAVPPILGKVVGLSVLKMLKEEKRVFCVKV